jgi:regulator of sigma E protease
VITVLAWIVVFGVLISIHELGHYVMAKVMDIRVDEFSLGFGPALWQRRRGETLYAVRAIPLGGYVRMAGMDPTDEPGPVTDARTYPAKPLWQRFLVIFAGPVMNLVLAAVVYMIAFGPVGMPAYTNTIGAMLRNFPAYQAGIRPGDTVVRVDGRSVTSWTQLATAIARHDARPVHLTVRTPRGALRRYVLGTKYYAATKSRIIGIEPASRAVHLPVGAAVEAGVQQTAALTGSWFAALARLVTGRGAFDVSGPVGIAVMVGQAVQQGWLSLLLLGAALSANLGLFNVLPVPVLDGSRLWLLAIEAVRRRPMDPVKENMIHMVGFFLLLAFVVFVTYHDLLRLVG